MILTEVGTAVNMAPVILYMVAMPIKDIPAEARLYTQIGLTDIKIT